MADNIESRTAVLEQISRSTEAILGEMRTDIREIRIQQDRQHTRLLSLNIASSAILLGALAHGFHLF